MGSKPAPFFADLLFFDYEWQYKNNVKKENVIYPSKCFPTSKFIDDLTVINKEYVKKNKQSTYPADMKLKKENHINKNSNFLDLNINIQSSRFQTMFYDKIDNFNFNII